MSVEGNQQVGHRAPVSINVADRLSLRPIEVMLRDAQLPVGGVADLIDRHGMITATDDAGHVVGAAGLEEHQPGWLLRSVVVRSEWRRRGVGSRLVSALLAQVPTDIGDVYLLTESAAEVFAALGFEVVSRASVSGPITESYEWREACADSATVMRWKAAQP